MKKIFLSIFILFSIGYKMDLFAQCGVEARIEISNDGWNNPFFSEDSTVLQPGWKKYNSIWTLNNDTTNNFWDMPLGFNKVCVTVWATDTVTGDSCLSTYCNIFQGAASIPWISLGCDSIAPLTYEFQVNMNTFYGFNPFFLLIFGDGDSVDVYSGSNYIHTYPGSGNYSAKLIVDGFPYNWSPLITYRTVHVDNGMPNISWISAGSYSVCDSIEIYAQASPWYNGSISFAISSTNASVLQYGQEINFQGGVPFKIPVFATPGIKLMQTTINDPNFGYAYKYDGVLTYACGVVPDTIRGKIFSDLDSDGILDSNENGLPGRAIWLWANNYYAISDSIGNYVLLKPNEPVSIHHFQNDIMTIPDNGYYYIAQTNQKYNFGVAVYKTYITGKAFIDYNSDSSYNSGDLLLKNVSIEAFNTTLLKSYFTSTDNLGNYNLLVPSGNYILHARTSMLDSAYFYPDSIYISSPGGGYFYNKNFAGYTNIQGANLAISLIGSSSFRPGFPCTLSSNVSNTGIDSTFGTITVHYDNNFYFDSISPPGSLVDTINHIIKWQTGYISTAENKSYQLFCQIPISLPIGTMVSNSASVKPDPSITENDTLNNSVNFNTILVGAIDPNEKLVSPTGIGPGGAVYHHQRLHYRINFQNTGTASAINVIVQDVLNADLDVSTILMENSSHPYTSFIDDHTITWKFLNINLPDSNFSEPQSHGYIEFSILPVQGLPDGTMLENKAYIYFDFNDPVITNNIQNTLQTYIPCDSVSLQNLKTSYCFGDTISAQILSEVPLSFSWSIDSIFISDNDSINLTNLSAGYHTFQVVAGNNLCSTNFNFPVNIFSKPVLNLGADTSTCFSSVFIDAGTGFLTYQWNTGDTSQFITATVTGNYQVTIIDSNGCKNSDSQNITINLLPVIDLGNDTAACDHLLLNAGNGFTGYQWSSGETTQSISVISSNTYSVIITDVNGCTNSDQVQITVNPLPIVSFNAFTTDTFCMSSGPHIISDGVPGGGVFTGNGISGNVFDPSVAGLGWNQIVYEFTDSLGCSNVATDSVFVDLCLGINAYQIKPEIIIFPNPVTDIIKIKCSKNNLPFSASLYDIFGIELKQIKSDQTEISIDLSELPSGNYLLVVHHKNDLIAIQRVVRL